MNISHLDFGRQAAENEQQFLQERFVPTNAYNIARDERRKRSYYVGRRGAGKSALLKQLIFDLSQTPGKNIIIEIAPSRFAYEMFKRFEYQFFDIRYMYMAAWEYTILIEIFKRALTFYETHGQRGKVQEYIEQIRHYMESNDLLNTPGGLDTFIRFLGIFSEREREFRSRDIMSGIDLLRWLNKGDMTNPLNALRNISQQYPIYIFIDELDRGWDNSFEARSFLNGLFAAVESLESLKQKGTKIEFYVSLRKDMFSNMAGVILEDQKMRDNIQRITWDSKMLKSLIAKRIQANLPASDRPHTEEDTLRKVFNKATVNRILELTLSNPREIIRLCNLCVEKHGERFPNDPSRRIDLDILGLVEKEFAEERYRHFCDEYAFEFPNLRHFLSWFEFGKVTYSKEEFLQKLKSAMEEFYFRNADNGWILKYVDNPLEMMVELYETGFLKFKDPVSEAFFTGYDYTHRFPSLENIQQVRIHEVFALALRCYQGSTFNPVSAAQNGAKKTFAVPANGKDHSPLQAPIAYSSETTTKKVFISYAQEDEGFVTRIRRQLRLLEREHKISIWSDQDIKPGQPRYEEIIAAMDEADLAILLVSPDFFNSDFIFEKELPALLRAATEGQKTIFPLHVRHSTALSYEPLARYQSINPPEQPLDILSDSEQERFLVLLADRILSNCSQ